MPRNRSAHPDDVRAFVVEAVDDARPRLARILQDQFGVSRATAHTYIRQLIDNGIIVRNGAGDYGLALDEHVFYHDPAGLQEDLVWLEEIAPALTGLPENVLDICRYGCTEMINNVIDHSESHTITIEVKRGPLDTDIYVRDKGVGIFRKIATVLELDDDRHAVLELSKGKVTTDPINHTGEGIFFSSRAFDRFSILSGGVFFTHEHGDDEDWILGEEQPVEQPQGTNVHMTMHNDSDTALNDVFDQYATDTDDYRFDRTVVPVRLLEYGDDHLVSRSQAKRLMNRFDRFRTVVLDFDGVPSIGPAFADEVFRVFPTQHPMVELVAIKANEQVSRMMNRARAPIDDDST